MILRHKEDDCIRTAPMLLCSKNTDECVGVFFLSFRIIAITTNFIQQFNQ